MDNNKTKKKYGILKLAITFFIFLLLYILFNPILKKIGLESLLKTLTYVRYGIGALCWLTFAGLANRILNVWLFQRVIGKNDDAHVPKLLKNVVTFIVYLLALVAIISFLLKESLTGILATTSVLGIVLGLALQSLIQDFFAGIVLNIDQPFKIGDYIEVESGEVGVVIDANWRSTRIQTVLDECILAIPNHKIFSSNIKNFSEPYPYYWQGIEICINHSVHPDRAIRILTAAAYSAEGVMNLPAPSVRMKEVNPQGIVYLVGYYPPNRGKFVVCRDAILKCIYNHLYHAGITFSINKQEIYTLPLAERQEELQVDKYRVIKRIDLFQVLTSEEQRQVADGMKKVQANEGEKIICQGDEGNSMFILVEGLLSVYIKEGEVEQMVAHLYPGHFFGEMSLFTGEKRAATIKSNIDTMLYELPLQAMEPIIKNRPELTDKIAKVVASRKNVTMNQWQRKRSEMEKQKGVVEEELLEKIRKFFIGIW